MSEPKRGGPQLSGGCQCGAVRFRVEAPPRRTSICHCRMCQKQFGAPFAAFGSWPSGDVIWTRGQRKTFQSSNAIVRGFCGDCGTPLTFEAKTGGKSIALALCAFDEPSALPPRRQIGMESRLSWLDDLNRLATQSPEEQAADAAKYDPYTSFQHPDHDTDKWPNP